MTITNQDVCEFFGFSAGLNLKLPGSMVMMLEGLKAKGYKWSITQGVYGVILDDICVHIGCLGSPDDATIQASATTAPLAVLEAVRQLVKEVRSSGRLEKVVSCVAVARDCIYNNNGECLVKLVSFDEAGLCESFILRKEGKP